MKNAQVLRPKVSGTGSVGSKPYSRTAIIVLAAIMAIALAVFLFRGWFRVTVMPKTAGLIYLNHVQQTKNEQVANLHDPFARLGFATVTSSRGCSLQVAQGMHTAIDCNVDAQAYTKLPRAAADVAKLQKEAAHLQSDLLASGWHDGSNGVTLTSLIDGTAHGIDYSPDAYYEKVSGDTDCVFDTFIAYANPQPPAIRSTFSCDRTVQFFGTPTNQVYSSAKGHL